jgi:4-amino-4-deoxy-L-arabinose transferase-like glycosyltransferase
MDGSLTTWVGRYRLFILALITLLGALLRLYQIGDLPPGDGYDTAQYGLDALQILDGARPIFLAANFGREVLFSYLVALVYIFTGPGVLGIHLSAALIGIATIPAVYFAARQLLEKDKTHLHVWVPLLAALVTAVSYWHLNYSRAGLRVIWVPFFAALVTGFLWRGLNRDSRWSLAAAGLFLGLSQYTYQAARLLPVLALGGFLFTYLSRRTFTRRDLVDLIVTFGLALLVFAPLGIFALQHPEIFNDRLRQTALLEQGADLSTQIASIVGQGQIALRMYFIEGDNEPLYTIPGRPSLNPLLALAFLAGILSALWRWKNPAMLYLLSWLVLLTLPAMIADQAATAKRALGAFPAAAILIALGLVAPYLVIARRTAARSRWPGLIYAGLVTLGLLWTFVVTFNDYFVRWGQDPSLAAHYQRDHLEVGLGISAVPREDAVLVSPFPADHPSIQLNSNRHPNLRSYDGHRCLVIPDAKSGSVHYFIVPGETERSLAQLEALFPNGILVDGPRRPDRDEVYYTQFTVPQVAAAELEKREDLIINWQDHIGLLDYSITPQKVSPNDSASITLTYRVLKDLDTNYTAYVHLVAQEGSPLISQVDSEPCGGALRTETWRAGDTIRDTLQVTIPENTPPGKYPLITGFYTWPDITPLEIQGADLGLIGELEVN